ncbi:hypothetical protein OIU79_006446, partial [Salix purpurea]
MGAQEKSQANSNSIQ